MLKASSLLYAIFICLVVSLICGSLILIFNYQYRLNQQFFLENELVNYSETNFLKVIDQLNTSQLSTNGSINSDDNRLTTTYSISKWGFYDLIKTKTYFKNDTIYKTGLIGSKTVNTKLALYLTDYNTELKIGGTTKIIGDVKVSSFGVEQAYINNQSFTGSRLVEGHIGVSKDKLPTLSLAVNQTVVEKELYYDELKNKTLYNSFYQPTIRVIVEETYDFGDIELSGNFVIESKDSLVIRETAQLKDVLIKAPKVTLNSGFNGNVQIFAKERVHVMKDVNLLYPSSIYIDNDDEEKPLNVYLGEKSKLAGGIVLTSKTYEASLNRLITIDKDAQVLGDIYCYGKTQLKGKVIGTVYTDRFYLETSGATYENHIVNGTINKLEQPNYFIGLPLFNDNTRVYELIKEL
ncbi:hypothetical protein [Winogradskyella forsetii]|uniref:hypothetical protein n=1 Tax=Winogradskyella forsetii TaxID=2686077 RepID=UPI0015BD6DBE|nr:hypothetical protein [Winogradskyella forsetii]